MRSQKVPFVGVDGSRWQIEVNDGPGVELPVMRADHASSQGNEHDETGIEGGSGGRAGSGSGTDWRPDPVTYISGGA